MILITGANGQLGYDFQRILANEGMEFIATSHNELDITDINSVRKFVKGKKISLIINCAAYNNVDKAEIEKESCYKLNAYAPRDLAIVAKEIDADFLTYSTDFVFNGEKKIPYVEEDKTAPLSIYSQSKFYGEQLVLDSYDRVFIIRTSWVFGINNNNFNKQVINWSRNKQILKIVDDQISTPTYSYDLAFYSLKLIKTKKYGLYHLSNNGIASKYEQAKYLLKAIGWEGTVLKAKSCEFNLPAKRAEFTKLDSSKLEKIIDDKIPSWKNAIDRFIEEMKDRGELK